MRVRKYPSVHPGKILKKEFMDVFGIRATALAKGLGVSRGRVSEILQGKRSISSETALRLHFFFGNSAEFWMNLQIRYDLKQEMLRSGGRLAREVNPH